MDKKRQTMVLLTLCISGTLSCNCEALNYFQGDYGPSVNALVFEFIELRILVLSIIDCNEVDTQWKIVRADGITEFYDLGLQHWRYSTGISEDYHQEAGIRISVHCSETSLYFCDMSMMFFLKDTRYDGAQITGAFRLTECHNSYNETNSVTINIRDSTPEPPTNLTVEVLSEESINMSWSPPSTLNGLPILYYTVYITSSQRPAEERNTTDTYIILERPCVPTSYQITAWNEVRQGAATSYDVNYNEPLERDSLKPGQICLSCSFIKGYMDDICGLQSSRGCLVRLESEATTYTFNFRDINDKTLILFDCFSIKEQTKLGVNVYYETDSGVIVQSNSGALHISTGIPTDFSSTVVPPDVVSLINSEVESVDGGVCVSCVFSSNSSAEGCTVTLYNDQYSFVFNVTRHSTEDIAVLECFKVPQSGVYSITVHETNVPEAVEPIRLPHVTITHFEVTPSHIRNDNNKMMAIVFSTGWGVTLVAVSFIIIMAIVLYLRRRLRSKNTENTESVRGPDAADATSQYYDDVGISQQTTSTVTPVVYDTVKQPHDAATGEEDSIIYELIELSSKTRQEKIKVVPNASYGTVQQ